MQLPSPLAYPSVSLSWCYEPAQLKEPLTSTVYVGVRVDDRLWIDELMTLQPVDQCTYVDPLLLSAVTLVTP